MKIEGTNWYTASGCHFHHIKNSERSEIEFLYGYRLPMQDQTEEERDAIVSLLKADGIKTKLKTSKKDHHGIPAGAPFLEVLDNESAANLEKIFTKSGIELSPSRYQEYGIKSFKRTSFPAKQNSIFKQAQGR